MKTIVFHSVNFLLSVVLSLLLLSPAQATFVEEGPVLGQAAPAPVISPGSGRRRRIGLYDLLA